MPTYVAVTDIHINGEVIRAGETVSKKDVEDDWDGLVQSAAVVDISAKPSPESTDVGVSSEEQKRLDRAEKARQVAVRGPNYEVETYAPEGAETSDDEDDNTGTTEPEKTPANAANAAANPGNK